MTELVLVWFVLICENMSKHFARMSKLVKPLHSTGTPIHNTLSVEMSELVKHLQSTSTPIRYTLSVVMFVASGELDQP